MKVDPVVSRYLNQKASGLKKSEKFINQQIENTDRSVRVQEDREERINRSVENIKRRKSTIESQKEDEMIAKETLDADIALREHQRVTERNIAQQDQNRAIRSEEQAKVITKKKIDLSI